MMSLLLLDSQMCVLGIRYKKNVDRYFFLFFSPKKSFQLFYDLLGPFQIDAPFWLLTYFFCPIEIEKWRFFVVLHTKPFLEQYSTVFVCVSICFTPTMRIFTIKIVYESLSALKTPSRYRMLSREFKPIFIFLIVETFLIINWW